VVGTGVVVVVGGVVVGDGVVGAVVYVTHRQIDVVIAFVVVSCLVVV
jgi:hypothetical protein